MIVIPIESESHTQDAVIVIFDASGLERLKMNDPGEVILRQCGKTLVNPSLMICFEQPSKELTGLLQKVGAQDEDALKNLVKFLQRGFKFQPELGDHDRGPERIGSQQ